jgi:hypothetical protein
MKPPTALAALAAVARYAQAQMTLPALSAFSFLPLFSTSAAPRGEALMRMSAYEPPPRSRSLSQPLSPSRRSAPALSPSPARA